MRQATLPPRKTIPSIFLCALLFAAAYAQDVAVPVRTEFLPEITSLRARIPGPDGRTTLNALLHAYNQDVQAAYRAIAAGNPVTLQCYRYTAQKDDTIFTLAARFSIPQETLATANALESADAPLAGKELVIPASPGLFVAKNPVSPLEIIVAQENAALLADGRPLPTYAIGAREFVFVQGAHISATARAFFLDTAMRIPLKDYVLTSPFGYRVSPISGTWKNHAGVDLAAPTGTPVHACKRGTVAYVFANDKIFGNYVIVRHANDMTSVYAHLADVSVRQGQEVSTGTKIGTVGMTGATTGPHLHFEVRQNGKPTNPLKH